MRHATQVYLVAWRVTLNVVLILSICGLRGEVYRGVFTDFVDPIVVYDPNNDGKLLGPIAVELRS